MITIKQDDEKEELIKQLNDVKEVLKEELSFEDRIEWLREKLKISSRLDWNYPGWRSG